MKKIVLPLSTTMFLLTFMPQLVRAQMTNQQPMTIARNDSPLPGPGASTKRLAPLQSSATSGGARVMIAADASLNDYMAYRKGDSFYVVIPQAIAPATQNALSGRGFMDALVEERGNNVLTTFRLQPGAMVSVSQKFNRIEVLFDVAGGPSAEAEKPLNEPRTASSKLLAVTDSVPRPAAPQDDTKDKDAIQQDNKIRVLNDADLGVPESPAFTVLGLNPQTVVRPTSPKEFATAFLNGLDEHGNFQTGLALDAVPYLVFLGEDVTLYSYNHNYMERLLARTTTSFATTKGASEDDKSVRLAIGVRATLWDKGDPRTDDQLFQCYTREEKGIKDFFLDHSVKDPDFQELLAKKKEEFKQVTDNCDEEARKRNWNNSGFVIGVAPSWISETGTTNSLRWNGAGAWASLAYGFEGVKGLEDSAQLIFHGRFRSNEQVADPDNQGQFFIQRSSLFGMRLQAGGVNTNAAFEGNFIHSKREGQNGDNSYRFSLGLERRIVENIWFALSLGGESGRRDGNNQAFLRTTFKWGVSKKEEATSPTMKANGQ